MYLDADSVGLSSFAPWLAALERADVVGVVSEWEAESVSVCSIGPVRARNRLLSACSGRIDRSLDAYWHSAWRVLHALTGYYPFAWTYFSRVLSETLDALLASDSDSASPRVRYVARSAVGEHGQLIALQYQLGARAHHIEQPKRPHLRFTFHDTEVLFYHASEERELQREPLERLLASDSLLVELHRFALWKCRREHHVSNSTARDSASAAGTGRAMPTAAEHMHMRSPSLLEQPRAGVFAVGGDDWRSHPWNAPEHLRWIAGYVHTLHDSHYAID